MAHPLDSAFWAKIEVIRFRPHHERTRPMATILLPMLFQTN